MGPTARLTRPRAIRGGEHSHSSCLPKPTQPARQRRPAGADQPLDRHTGHRRPGPAAAPAARHRPGRRPRRDRVHPAAVGRDDLRPVELSLRPVDRHGLLLGLHVEARDRRRGVGRVLARAAAARGDGFSWSANLPDEAGRGRVLASSRITARRRTGARTRTPLNCASNSAGRKGDRLPVPRGRLAMSAAGAADRARRRPVIPTSGRCQVEAVEWPVSTRSVDETGLAPVCCTSSAVVADRTNVPALGQPSWLDCYSDRLPGD